MLFGDAKATLVLVFCVLCHECAHLLAASILGVKVKDVRLNLFGARIELVDMLSSYISEFIIAASGPAMNILLAFLGMIFMKDSQSYRENFFTCVNLSLALVNLLPISTLDGGRMLYTATSYIFGADRAQLILHYTSMVMIVFLWGISVVLWFCFEQNISLLVFCLYLFYSIVIKRGY